MAPSPENAYKDYFDNKTLSDLTLRIGDRLVHVHRIVLSSHSAYFEKLLTSGFKTEIELHEDDPTAIDVVLRHMYDLPCDDALDIRNASLESLAMIYVTADKYQVVSLKDKVYRKIKWHENYWHLTHVEDFLAALEVIITGTTPDDKIARAAMIDACIKHINLLKQKPGFSALLRDHGDIGAEILQHSRLPLMLEGTWKCDGFYRRPEAVPSCRKCDEPYPDAYVRSHRHLKAWASPNCLSKEHPVCLRCSVDGKGCPVKWQWRDESG